MWFCFPFSAASRSLSASAVSSHARSFLSSSNLVVIAIAASLRDFSPSVFWSLRLLSSAVAPAWDQFLWQNGGGHWAQVSQTQRRGCELCVCVHLCLLVEGLAGGILQIYADPLHASPRKHLSACMQCDCAAGCILVWNWVDCCRSDQHLGLFFSASPLFLSPSSWPCFNKAARSVVFLLLFFFR